MHRSPPRICTLLLAYAITLTGCGSNDPSKMEDRSAKPGLTTILESGGIPWVFGSDMPDTNLPDATSIEEAEARGRKQFDRWCPHLQTRIVSGKISSDGRICHLVSVDGLISSATLLYKGTLVTDEGERLQTVWQTSVLLNGIDVAQACREDPTQGRNGPWILSRSASDRLWMLAPANEMDKEDTIYLSGITQDWVRQHCAAHEASKQRVKRLTQDQSSRP